MGIKIKTVKNNIPQLNKTFKVLDGKKVQVGVLTGEHKWLAGIHEYGCNIQATKAKYLTIPCNRKAYGKKASEFNDLFTIETKEGTKFLVREKGKNQLEFMYWLTPSVYIPERSFLRSGFDENHDKAVKQAERALSTGLFDADEVCNNLGAYLSKQIKLFARDLDSPKKNNVTIEAEGGKSNPLVNTGDMIGGISYRVE